MTNGERKEEKHKFISPLKKNKNSIASVSKTNSISARIRKIGNSKGIILSNSMISELGVEEGTEVIITLEKGRIIITPAAYKRKINTDLSSWEAQFDEAIKNGGKPEEDMFEAMENKFDKEEW